MPLVQMTFLLFSTRNIKVFVLRRSSVWWCKLLTLAKKPKGLSHTVITFVPKVASPLSMDQFVQYSLSSDFQFLVTRIRPSLTL